MRIQRYGKQLGVSLLSMLAINMAHADTETQDDATLFDATALAHACLNCHNPQAQAHTGDRLAIPAITDKTAETTYQLLVAFQQAELPPNTTIMNRLIAPYSDAELKAIAEAVSAIQVEQ